MQNETYFTSQGKTKPVTNVFRKSDGSLAGTITMKHMGKIVYQANHGAGLRYNFLTKAAAFNSFK